MTVDPTPPPSEDPPEDAPALPVEKNGTDSVEFRTSGMRRYRKGDVEIAEGDDDEGEILVVSVKLRPSGGGGGGGGGGTAARRRVVEPEEPEPKSSKVNRFATKAAGPVFPVPGAAAAAPAAPMADDPSAPPPGAPRAKFTPRTAHGAAGKSAWVSNPLPPWWTTKNIILTLALLAAGFMAGRRFGHPDAVSQKAAGGRSGAPPPKLTTTWAPGRMAQLDAVLAADEKGDLKLARELVLDIKKDVPDSPELDLYLTTVQVRQGEFKIPENDLAKMIDAFTPPREAAAINAHLGFLYARHRDFPRAVMAFSDAASTEPFNPSHFQHWAEALRREGQLQEAIDHFQQALARLPAGPPENSSPREEIGLKIRLAQIEMGKDEEVKAALDTHLKAPAPNGYWLLTGAAYGLQHNDVSLAVSSLQKARVVLSADDYNALTNDYFFHSFSGGQDVAALLPADTPAARTQPFLPRMGHFIDP